MVARLRSTLLVPSVTAISRREAKTPRTVRMGMGNMVRWVERQVCATMPRSPCCVYSSFTPASLRPVASASAFTSVASPMPSSTLSWAGASEQVAR